MKNVPLAVIMAHYNAQSILIEGVKLLPPAQRAKVLADWDAARNMKSTEQAEIKPTTDGLIDAIENATVELTVNVPSTDFYARPFDFDTRTINYVDGQVLISLLRDRT